MSLTASFQQYGRFCQCIKFNALLLSASQRCWSNIFLQVLGISISHQFSRLQGRFLEMCSGRAGPSVSKRQKIKQSQSTSNNARGAMKHAEGFRSPAQISSPICVPGHQPAATCVSTRLHSYPFVPMPYKLVVEVLIICFIDAPASCISLFWGIIATRRGNLSFVLLKWLSSSPCTGGGCT